MAAWEEGRKVVEQAKLFAGTIFFILLFLAIYSAYVGKAFDAAYFACFSIISLGLYLYVRKTFKVKAS